MQDSQRSKRNLRSLIIEPFQQLRIGLWAIGISVVFVFVIAAMITVSFYSQYEHMMEVFSVDPSLKWELIWNEAIIRNVYIMAAIFISYLAIMCFVIFKMTHKVYGPLVSIERFIKKLEGGNYSERIRLREKDDLKRLASKLNELAEKLDQNNK